ncbi:hypothetical protein DIS24_g5889 [Lasiodiplodia hormozganensis]|uniref:Uncharacterized protein n=1 Tax=Lasiodiplodia hormozganensis TaxID=869390 RepID=A0AA40CW72_9PEZI|nr:hypothetical protein DIS24_g5889 [Lasiodiplodia hormozganensis]
MAPLEISRQQRLPHVLDEEALRGALSVFPWPSVQVLLAGADRTTAKDLEGILAEGSGWLVRHEMLNESEALPCDVFLRGTSLHIVRGDKGQSRIAFPDLTAESMDRWYYLDLNLPRSDASEFQEFIALPDFDDRRNFGGEISIESKYQYNFLSMISLRRLIHRSFEELYDPAGGGNDGDKADRTIIIAELSRQLDVWRSLLPPELRWDDAARTTYDNIDEQMSSRSAPLPHIDILLAQLRCRYYYARFMIFRPYVWKALHAPPALLFAQASSTVVIDGFVNAVDSMLQWPVAYPPVCDKKRLVPNIFAWTQSFVMFLLVLRAIKENELLWDICRERLGRARIEESVVVMLEWIEDLRMVDGVAAWAWRTLKPLYGLGG